MKTLYLRFLWHPEQENWADRIFNVCPSIAAYMRLWTVPPLVHLMACHLFGARPLPEPMLAYFNWTPGYKPNFSEFEAEVNNFKSRICIWKCSLLKWRAFCQGGDELNLVPSSSCEEHFGGMKISESESESIIVYSINIHSIHLQIKLHNAITLTHM